MLLPGEPGLYEPDGVAPGEESELLIVSYANGLRLSLRAQRRLSEEHGVAARVLDLRWLSPLPTDALREASARSASVLVVDESRATGGGVADAILADLAEHDIGARMRSVRAVDSFIPLGPAAEVVLPSLDGIVAAALASVRASASTRVRR